MNSYPKIHSIGTKYVRDIFIEPVEITEKLDGSQFGFGRISGELIIRSKGTIINQSNPDNLFNEGVAYIKSIEDRLPDNTFFYGEYFKKPKHNTIAYDRIPKHHIALFGVLVMPDMFVDDYGALQRYADMIGIEPIPLLHRGMVYSKDFLSQYMNQVYLTHRKDLMKHATQGMPEWYKDQIASQSNFIGDIE